MDRSIGSGFRIPAASLLSFIPITIILFIPIYDCIFVRIARALTGKPSGITMLQRSGIGFLLCVVSMVTAAIVEMKRLKTAKEYGLVDMPNVTVPMRVWWLIPQYILLGIADVFAMVGLQEFFYDQIPNELRSVGLSLYLSIYGVGSFLSGFLISIIEETTGGDGKTSWFNNNLNRAHIDNFYWLLAGLSAVELAAFLYFAKSYVYNGLGLLTLSAVLPFQSTFDCQNTHQSTSCSPPELRIIFFFISLYLVAVAQGGYKPCTQALGADQFDGQNREENKAKSSFFNWWLFCLSACTSVSYVILSYIQDNLSWGLGFGIPCTVMIASLLIFLLGTKTYRYILKGDEKSPLLRIGKVFVEAARNWRTSPSLKATEEVTQGTLPHQGSHQFKFLNKALPMQDYLEEGGDACTVKDVEEAKAVLRLFPIWSTCLVYGIVHAQSSTLFTKQGNTMDRSIGSGFDIPAASLQSIVPITIVLSIPIYDCIFVPIARALTRKPSGITMLQRIGTGGFLYAISMVIAAIVEIKRLKTAQEHGLLDMPNVAVPMKVWWLVPQYAMFGVADVFAVGGLQEFFYDQVPSELRSVGLSLYLSLFGVGSFLSGFLISAIEKATGGDGRSSWFNSNLNRAHLDYFYWLLAGLTAVGLAAFSHFAKSYIYNRRVIF
ncbi:hypothetical protein VitviT2T_028876 [Vitis vinifera]|nr:hypothetical protein VitviT2T_028876 [Vitis vinifera]